MMHNIRIIRGVSRWYWPAPTLTPVPYSTPRQLAAHANMDVKFLSKLLAPSYPHLNPACFNPRIQISVLVLR